MAPVATALAIFRGSARGEVSRRFEIPALENSSASGTVATQRPIAPPAIWRRAISTHLWALAWGRSALPELRTCEAIKERLESKASRFRRRAGVGTSEMVCTLFNYRMVSLILITPRIVIASE